MQKARSSNDSPSVAQAPVLLRYAVAVACILVAFSLRYFFTPVMGEESPFMLFVAAALVAAWYGGAVAGSVSLLLGLFLADYFFLSKGGPVVSHSVETFRVIRYVFTASLGIVLIEVLHRNRRTLEAEVARRIRSEQSLFEAQAQLKKHADELEQRVAERTATLAATVESLQGLLYHIAHNFRAPLRAMEGYTAVLMEEYASRMDATAQQYGRHICDAAERMDELIYDLLEYGRLGHVELALSKLDPEKIIQKVIFRLTYEIQRRKAEVKVAGAYPEIRANPEVLEQVLTNLVENAVKFVPPERTPRVQIRPEPRNGSLRIWIEDNGIGIEPRYYERIFGAFERLNPKGGYPGTGIGLAIVRQGMQRMAGQVGVDSQLGCGSRFWIELPLADSLATRIWKDGGPNSPQINSSTNSSESRHRDTAPRR
jgi:signal transduction histidine kinase